MSDRRLDPEPMRRARELLRSSQRTLVLTGAGVSAESGVPTFRGPDGLWKSHRPEQLATARGFQADPRLVWEWYGWRRERVAACHPNAAHEALAYRTVQDPHSRIVTQNVDGLHELALESTPEPSRGSSRPSTLEAAGAGGSTPPSPARPLELHGSLYRVRCTSCRFSARHRDPIDATSDVTLPRCPECADLLRPDVVWFGEALDPRVLRTAMEEAERAEVCLVVGTSAVVQPAASLPLVTREAGGVIIEINLEATPLSKVAQISLKGTAASIVPRLLMA